MPRLRACLVLVMLVGGVAYAEEPVAPVTDPGAAPAGEPRLLPRAKSTAPEAGWSHRKQLQLSLRTSVGLRAIVPYDDVNYCGDSDPQNTNGNAPVCTGRAPFSIDLELGYGVARKIDLVLEMRIGLESDFAATAFAGGSGPRMFHLAPGARFFFSDSRSSKLFTTAQVVFDFAGYEDAAGMARGADFGVRNLNGMWFDLDKAYGFYVYVGETATFGRWLRFELEAGIGIQGRYP